MAWNPSPKVADLRDISRKWGYNQIVVLAVNTKTGKFETVSYGETRALCDAARRINEHIYNEVVDGTLDVDATPTLGNATPDELRTKIKDIIRDAFACGFNAETPDALNFFDGFALADEALDGIGV